MENKQSMYPKEEQIVKIREHGQKKGQKYIVIERQRKNGKIAYINSRKSKDGQYTQRKKGKIERVYLIKALKSKSQRHKGSKSQRRAPMSTRVDQHCLQASGHIKKKVHVTSQNLRPTISFLIHKTHYRKQHQVILFHKTIDHMSQKHIIRQ